MTIKCYLFYNKLVFFKKIIIKNVILKKETINIIKNNIKELDK